MSDQNTAAQSAKSKRAKPVLPNSDGLPKCEVEDLRTPYERGHRKVVDAIIEERQRMYRGTTPEFRACLDQHNLTREQRRGVLRGLNDDCIPLRGMIWRYEAKEILLLLDLALSRGLRMSAKDVRALTLQLQQAFRLSDADIRNPEQN